MQCLDMLPLPKKHSSSRPWKTEPVTFSNIRLPHCLQFRSPVSANRFMYYWNECGQHKTKQRLSVCRDEFIQVVFWIKDKCKHSAVEWVRIPLQIIHPPHPALSLFLYFTIQGGWWVHCIIKFGGDTGPARSWAQLRKARSVISDKFVVSEPCYSSSKRSQVRFWDRNPALCNWAQSCWFLRGERGTRGQWV